MRSERIILADDHPVFREGLLRLIQRIAPQAEIVEASNFLEILELARKGDPPTTLVIDLIFAGQSIEPKLSGLRREFPQASIIFVSMIEDRDVAERIIAKGADGFISKSLPPREITAAIAAVRDGDQVLQLKTIAASLPPIEDETVTLTQRQREVLRLLSAGKSNKEIAQELQISPFTVRIHVSALLKTLRVSSRAAAASKATAYGLA